MSTEEILPAPKNKPPYRKVLESAIAGRDEGHMREEVARALHVAAPAISSKEAISLLAEIKPRTVYKEGMRKRSVAEIYAVIEVAVKSHDSDPQKQWPTLDGLADAIRMNRADLDGIVRSKAFPEKLRKTIIRADQRFVPKKAKR